MPLLGLGVLDILWFTTHVHHHDIGYLAFNWLIGAILSLVVLIRHTAHPHVAFLGRIPGTRRFSDRQRHPDNEEVSGMLIIRPESSLIYFNVDHVRDAITARIHKETLPPKQVVLDLSASANMDLQSAQTMIELADELVASGIRFQVVEAHAAVRDRLRSQGMDTKLGGVNRFTTVADAVEAYQNGIEGGTDNIQSEEGLEN